MVAPPGTRPAVGRLADSLLAVGPLVAQLTAPVRIVPLRSDGTGPPPPEVAGLGSAWVRLLRRVASRVGVDGLVFEPHPDAAALGVFERVVSTRLALADVIDTLPVDPDDPAVDRAADEAVSTGLDAVFQRQSTAASDGLPLTVYGAGNGAEVVVLATACGMPARLAEPWLRYLARDHRVLTWETRGMFGAPLVEDYGSDGDALRVDAAVQAEDMFRLMDHFGAESAHVVGLCGGAVIGLAAAAARPDRVRSLSLWHGAYELAGGSPRTTFQNDLIELMTVAATSRAAARSVQAAFCQVTLTNTPAELAHLVLYPYTTADLFHRYCRLNGTLARTDVTPFLAAVSQPTLVVTSTDDETAHPEGSRRVAGGLRHASLRVQPHGDHTTLFQAADYLPRVAADFIRRQAG